MLFSHAANGHPVQQLHGSIRQLHCSSPRYGNAGLHSHNYTRRNSTPAQRFMFLAGFLSRPCQVVRCWYTASYTTSHRHASYSPVRASKVLPSHARHAAALKTVRFLTPPTTTRSSSMFLAIPPWGLAGAHNGMPSNTQDRSLVPAASHINPTHCNFTPPQKLPSHLLCCPCSAPCYTNCDTHPRKAPTMRPTAA